MYGELGGGISPSTFKSLSPQCSYLIFCLQNHIVERIWAEVNPRINYPVKAILVELMEAGDIDIDNPLHLFCVSWVTIRVVSTGVELFIKSWNNHPIPGMYFTQSMVLHAASSLDCIHFDPFLLNL